MWLKVIVELSISCALNDLMSGLNDDILLGCIQYNLRMQIMWSFTSNGTYAVPSLYAVINHRGFTPVFVSAIWKLNVPPRIHFFLWAALLAAAAKKQAVALFIQALKKPAAACCKFLILPGYDLLYYWS